MFLLLGVLTRFQWFGTNANKCDVFWLDTWIALRFPPRSSRCFGSVAGGMASTHRDWRQGKTTTQRGGSDNVGFYLDFLFPKHMHGNGIRNLWMKAHLHNERYIQISWCLVLVAEDSFFITCRNAYPRLGTADTCCCGALRSVYAQTIRVGSPVPRMISRTGWTLPIFRSRATDRRWLIRRTRVHV